MKQKFNISGMCCSACATHIEDHIKKLKGVNRANVNLLSNIMEVEYNSYELDSNQILRTVWECGYGATLQANPSYIEEPNCMDPDSMKSMNRELRIAERRLLVSFAFSVPLFYFVMAQTMNWSLPKILLGLENTLIFSFTQFLLILPIIYVNRNCFREGFSVLLKGKPNAKSFLALGTASALVYGVYMIYTIGYGLGHNRAFQVLEASMNLYFQSVGVILTLTAAGHYLEMRLKGKNSDAISKLMELCPKYAVVMRNNQKKEIPIEEVKKYDLVLVKEGEMIPVDGIIVDGGAFIDQSSLTGESLPEYKGIGERVLAATKNINGQLKIEATHVSDDTVLYKIISMIEEATSAKTPMRKLSDELSYIFVPITILVGLLTMGVWVIWGYPFDFAFSTMLSVLMVACPSAIGIATPISMLVGNSMGLQNGILIKSMEALELSRMIDTVIIDKTGTITEGKPVVTDIFIQPSISEEEFLIIAASIERGATHPIAHAIVEEAQERNLELCEVDSFVALCGRGIEAKLKESHYLAGNTQFMREHHIKMSGFLDISNQLSMAGKTPIYFAKDFQLIGMLAVSDCIRPSSKAAVEKLYSMGIDIVMLTGDNQTTTEVIRKQVGIKKAISDVLPQDKENEIKRLQEKGQIVAMIGEGINDAPALMKADVGIAIGAATDIAMESADIVLMNNNLLDVVLTIELSKSVMRNVKQNQFFTFIFQLMGIPVAAGVFYLNFGWRLTPMLFSMIISISLVFVVANSLRLKLSRRNDPLDVEEDFTVGQEKLQGNSLLYDNTKLQRDVLLKRNPEREEVVQANTFLVKINGMMCSHCAERVETMLNSIDGVSAKVDLNGKVATIILTKKLNRQTLKNAVAAAGYEVISIEKKE